jgi:2-polyprenyl-3-methyl-5-hydroxy-6-metoxy-1,4-benzoquinol methylase
MSVLSADDLRYYSAPVLQPGPRTELAARTGLSLGRASLYLDAICNEAQTGLRLLEIAEINSAHRILEVGAGGGLLTGFLQSRGFNVVAIEPTGDGFEATPRLAEVIRKATGVTANIANSAARNLNPAEHGTFDLIFSVNVIEHFQPLKENLDALALVMNSNAVQIHTTPNYRIPYEPHYGIPILPLAPHLTPFLGNRRAENLWRSLNFVTSKDLRSYAERFGLSISFQRGALYDSLERLCAEPEFAARHPKILHNAARLIRASGLIYLLKKLPPEWVTPMTVTLRRN